MVPIRIKVGCSLASGWDKPFVRIEQRSRKSAQVVGGNLSGIGRGSRRGSRRGAQETWARHHLAAEKRATRSTRAEARKRLAEIRREMRKRNREHRELLKEVERNERAAARQQARIRRKHLKQEKAANKERERFARRTSHRTTRFFWPNAPVASWARRGAMDLARGMGVETNFAGLMGRVVESDKAARELSVKGYIEGAEGAPGKRVDPKVLREEARALGEEMAMTTEEILRGQSAFVDLRGNLAGARDIAKDMAKLSRSQGANYRDVMYMAGKAEAMFESQAEYAGDELKKREAINSLMRTTVYQAKKFSIPVAEMAKQFPKLAGVAPLFEGDVGKNVVQLMATAQYAGAGAAKNSATAATFAMNPALKLKARGQQFENIAGVNIFSDKERNKLRDFSDIIADTLEATEQTRVVKRRGQRAREMNQLEQLQAIIPNIRAELGISKYQEIFTEAGGGKKGAAAVRAAFAEAAKGTKVSQQNKDLALVLDSTEAKAKKFNQQLEKVVASMAEKLIPAFEKLAPELLKLAEAFSGVIHWAAENPGKAITLAIAGSIARAGLESTFRAGIERAIMASTSGGGAAFGKSIGALGNFSNALMLASTALASYAATVAFVDWHTGLKAKRQSEAVMTDVQAHVEVSNAERIARERGGLSRERFQKLSTIREQMQQRVKDAEQAKGGLFVTFSEKRYQQVKQDKANLAELKADLQTINQTLAAGIRVTNIAEAKPDVPPAAPPGIDPSGRGTQ